MNYCFCESKDPNVVVEHLSVCIKGKHLEEDYLPEITYQYMQSLGWSMREIFLDNDLNGVVSAIVYFKNRGRVLSFYGRSKCHPHDEFDFKTGCDIAVLRATLKLLDIIK